MTTKILATIGPASLNKETIEKLSTRGVYLFRINLSHTKLADVEDIINKIHQWTDVPVCLDSEGAQIRNQDMVNESVYFEKGSVVKVHHDQVIGDSENISFTPDSVSRQLREGDLIRVDFNAVTLRIIENKKEYLLASIENSGHVGSNKAADVDRHITLDPITPKDQEAFKIGLENGIKNYSLSFTNTADDVAKVRSIIGRDSNLICKIESIKGVLNLGEILPVTDQILIDRGDLSREVSIEKIPFKETPVFVATNLLESMIKSSVPTRAEANDVASTLLMGASGLVLAAETAIGAYPVGAVDMINSIIKQYGRWTPDSSCRDIIF